MGLGLCFVLGLFLFIAIHKQRPQAVVSETGWASGLRHIVNGIPAMGNWRTMLAATGASLLYLALQVAPVWALMDGYGLDLSIWPAAAGASPLLLRPVNPDAPARAARCHTDCVLGHGGFGV